MSQLHQRFSDEQVAFLFQTYEQGLMSREEVQEALDIRRSRFFVLLKDYRTDPEAFTISYQRKTPGRISLKAETAIQRELLREKDLIDDPEIPISGYNYSALRDRLRKAGIQVSVNTIIDRAKKLDCHKPRKKRKVHDREVLTASVGELIQHDGSTHRWSGCSQEKWTLVTSIDDYSRKILFADFFSSESTWAHIRAVQALIQAHGVPLRYYVDCLRVFRFVQGRDSFWRKHILKTDDVDTQWGKMMQLLGIKVIFALSPQGKARLIDPTVGCKIALSELAVLKRLMMLMEHVLFSMKSLTATTTIRCTLRPKRFPPFVSIAPSPKAKAFYVLSPSLNPIHPQRMYFA
jgi:hypothetical protein